MGTETMSDKDTPPGALPADDGFEEPTNVNWHEVADALDTDDEGGDGTPASTVEGDTEVVEPAGTIPAAPKTAADLAPAPAPAAAAAPASPAQPLTTSAPSGTPAAVVPATSTPGEPAAPSTGTPVPPPAASAPEPAVPPVDYEKWRGERLAVLEGSYKLSEDEAAQALTEPEVLLPKLMAKVHMSLLEQTMQGVQAYVPQLIRQVRVSDDTEARARQEFYSYNPDLNDPKYEAAVLQAGPAFRAVHKNATREQVLVGVGNMVRSMFGLPQPQTPGTTPMAAGTPAPAAPAAPFAPVRGGGSAAAGSKPAPGNPFTELAESMMTDDD